jgi:hypothetical protein
MSRSILTAFLVVGLVSACGSSTTTSNPSTSTPTGTGGSTSAPPSGDAFVASCMMVTTITAGTVVVSSTICVDYHSGARVSAADVQASCTSKPGATMTMTFSADHCPTANL